MVVCFPAQLKTPATWSIWACLTLTISSVRVSVDQILYLSCLPGFAEEWGLGCEESEVFALIVQAAVPTAHAVTAGHGGGHHCVDSHGEVQRWPPAPAQHRSGTLTAWGSAGWFFLAKKAGLMWKSATIRVCTRLTVLYSSRKSQRSTADASRELESHLWGRNRWTRLRLGALRATGEGTRKSESEHRRVTSSCVYALTPVSQTHTIQ